MKIKKKWLVFFYEGKEIFRYTLKDTFPGEREETMKLLAYERDIPVSAICFAVITA